MKILPSALALGGSFCLSLAAALAQDAAPPVTAAPAAADMAADTSAADEDEALRDQIIVEGERPLSRQEITKSLRELTGRTGLFDPVPRFISPVCVLVTGLGDPFDSKIADRIRANIAAVGLPVAGKKCRPNAITIITDQPQATYSRIRQTRPGLIGVGISPYTNSILDLREYSKTLLESQLKSGAPAVSWSTFAMDLQDQGATQGVVSGTAFWGWNARPPIARGGRPRGSSVVLFDSKQIVGVRVHQLADFATVHLLGSPRIKSGKAATTVPTILTLFDKDPKQAPQRLTTFDRAYLCGIYHLREGSLGTRMARNVIEVYDSECVRVGAPAD